MQREQAKAIEYLMSAVSSDSEVERLLDECRRLENLAECCGAMQLTDKVMTSPSPDKMERAVIELDETKEKLYDKLNEDNQIRNNALAKLMTLDDPADREILYRHYFQNEALTDITKKIGYQYSTVVKKHNRALRKLSKKIY